MRGKVSRPGDFHIVGQRERTSSVSRAARATFSREEGFWRRSPWPSPLGKTDVVFIRKDDVAAPTVPRGLKVCYNELRKITRFFFAVL